MGGEEGRVFPLMICAWFGLPLVGAWFGLPLVGAPSLCAHSFHQVAPL